MDIKPYVDELDQQIMFAEKSWGSYRVIDVEEESMTVKVTLNPGHSMNYHSHEKRDEVWTVISGKGRTIVDGMEQLVSPGDVITMQAGCRHTVIADTELKLIEVQLGKEINVRDTLKACLLHAAKLCALQMLAQEHAKHGGRHGVFLLLPRKAQTRIVGACIDQ